TGANVHVCADRSMFVSYQAVHDRTVTMENSTAARVFRIGRVDLRFSSGRVLSIPQVHHVPSVKRNIISGSILVSNKFELVFKCNKVVILYLKSFIGKGYLSDGLFKIHVDHVVSNGMDVNSSSTPISITYNVEESSDIWHGRLGHVNFNTLKR